MMSASTVWMLSRVSDSSASDANCLLVSEYRNSIRRGAKAWIYGVATLRSGVEKIVRIVCTHFSFTWQHSQ